MIRHTERFDGRDLDLYETGKLLSTKPSKNEKEKFKATAQATGLKDKRVNMHPLIF